jgi:peptidoglycan/LPS O-acetylase OafA/YrhL
VAGQVFTTLNALRGVAAIAVATTHWRVVFGVCHAQSGYLAVDLFFLLSGFVIAYSYDAKLQATWTVSQFLKVRIIRLYPMYMLGLCATVIGIFLFDTADRMGATSYEIAGTFFFNIFMLPLSLMKQSHAVFPLNSPAWTLCLEVVCNLIYALLYRFTKLGNLLVCAVISAAGLVTVALTYGTINLGFSQSNFFVGLFRVGFSFSVGVMMCRVCQKELFTNFRFPGGIAVALCIFLLFSRPVNQPIFELICVIILFPFILLIGVRSEFNKRISDFLGNISYPLYAIHMPILSIILVTFKGYSPSALALWGLLCLMTLVGVSALLHQYFDRPIRAKLMRRF